MTDKNAWRLFEATGMPQAYMIYSGVREQKSAHRNIKNQKRTGDGV